MVEPRTPSAYGGGDDDDDDAEQQSLFFLSYLFSIYYVTYFVDTEKCNTNNNMVVGDVYLILQQLASFFFVHS